MRKFRFNFLFWSLVSLLIHLIYFMGLNLVPETWYHPTPSVSTQTVEIDFVTEKPELSKQQVQQFVRQTEAQENLLADSKEKARFKSEKDQRVLIETRAREVGITKNRSAEAKFLKQAREDKERTQKEKASREFKKLKLSQTGIDYSDFKPLDVKKELTDLGASTVGEALPQDVSIGSFTALNTDRFTFYTFYARIEELVRFRWETKVKESVDSFNRNFLISVVLKKNWVTTLEFLLTPTGELRQVKILKESGIAKFDQAPIWAFKDARVFPNPPSGMVGPDGFIHLNYSFNVQLGSEAWAER